MLGYEILKNGAELQGPGGALIVTRESMIVIGEIGPQAVNDLETGLAYPMFGIWKEYSILAKEIVPVIRLKDIGMPLDDGQKELTGNSPRSRGNMRGTLLNSAKQTMQDMAS
jgi:hypothetical protein